MRKVIVAKSAGFCWGVRRAFEKVLKVAADAPKGHSVRTYGPLIHNPQAVEMLEKKGIGVIDEITADVDGTVVIRTHGVPPDELQRLRKSGATVVNATCPDVGRIQGLVKKYARLGYGIVIIGDEEHPEVKALLGFAKSNGRCVIDDADIDGLPNWSKVCVVSQSTQPHFKFWELVDSIKRRFPNAQVFDTICCSTEQRQEEARELSRCVEVMVVVGGRNSANTNRLAEICLESGTPTFHVETADELDPVKISQYNCIGVTAGASTPGWVIEDVVKFLKELP